MVRTVHTEVVVITVAEFQYIFLSKPWIDLVLERPEIFATARHVS